MTLFDMEELNEEIQTEADHNCTIVQLFPFQHQVGGHNCVLSYDEKTICKPLDEQEHRVYSDFPDKLRDFIPKLYGVVKVHFEKCGDDVLCFALPLDCSYCEDLKRLKNYVVAKNALTQGTLVISKKILEETGNNNSEQARWSSIMKERLLTQWKQNRKKGNHLEKFMLLENVSKRFAYPCALDLKMGTRGFGDSASHEKRERKQKRANLSTSASLGVRLCGMQVYHPAHNKFMFTDKYKGRYFTEHDFKNCMQDFIYNGSLHRIELITPLIEKLKILLEQIENIDCYRFYCSSLLLLYDGSLPNGTNAEIEVRMIDFAHTRVKSEESNPHVGPDRGYITGVKTLIDVFTEIYDDLIT